jgi:hypothetical protein
MTYFGVNYYLSGLHSYAKGDPVPIPSWVYITVTSIFAIAFISYFRYKQFGKSSNESHPVGRKTAFERA